MHPDHPSIKEAAIEALGRFRKRWIPNRQEVIDEIWAELRVYVESHATAQIAEIEAEAIRIADRITRADGREYTRQNSIPWDNGTPIEVCSSNGCGRPQGILPDESAEVSELLEHLNEAILSYLDPDASPDELSRSQLDGLRSRLRQQNLHDLAAGLGRRSLRKLLEIYLQVLAGRDEQSIPQ